MSLKVSPLLHSNHLPADHSAHPLSHDSLRQIISLIQRSSLIDLQSCRQVCREWRKVTDILIFEKRLSHLYSNAVENATTAIQAFRDKQLQSLMMSRLAKILGDGSQAHDLLRQAFKIAEKIGWTSEYCDEDGSKPREYDGERITCYLKILQAYASFGRIDEIVNCMKDSEQALEIAKEDFKGKDLHVYTDIAKIFVPLGSLEQILPIIQNHPYYDSHRSLFVRLIKTYRLESQHHALFLRELNSDLDKALDLVKQYSPSRPSYLNYSLFLGLDRCLQSIKGYCYLGHLEKAVEIIRHLEDETKKLGADQLRSSKEWFSKAYLFVAKASAHLGQIEQTQAMTKKISEDSVSFLKEIVNATSCFKGKDQENGVKFLNRAVKEAEGHRYGKGCSAHLEIAQLFFENQDLFEAFRHLKKAEEKAKQFQSHRGETFLRLAKVSRSLILSTPKDS